MAFARKTDGVNTVYANDVNELQAAVETLQKVAVNVLDYGATGDGVTDDTAAFQAAINAAITAHGCLVIPAIANRSNFYKITDTLVITPNTGDGFVYMDIISYGFSGMIRWVGASSKPVFQAWNWKNSSITGVEIQISQGNDVTGWDMASDATRQSSSWLNWTNCRVAIASTSSWSCCGWRALNRAGSGDVSFQQWNSCVVSTNSVATGHNGHIGWQNLAANALIWDLTNCTGYFVNTMFTNGVGQTTLSTAIDAVADPVNLTVAYADLFPYGGTVLMSTGEKMTYTSRSNTQLLNCARAQAGTSKTAAGVGAVVTQVETATIGGAGMSFFGCGNSNCDRDFYFATTRSNAIVGGRYETGKRFVTVGTGGNSGQGQLVISGVLVVGYEPADGVVIAALRPIALDIRGCSFPGSTHPDTSPTALYTANFISTGGVDGLGGGGGGRGNLSLENCAVYATTDTVWNLGATWSLSAEGSVYVNIADQPQGRLNSGLSAQTATYTALPSDRAITMSAAAAARTVNLYSAANEKGREIVVKKIDNTANAVTVDAAGSETIDGALAYALTVANQFVRLVSDGANWLVVGKG